MLNSTPRGQFRRSLIAAAVAAVAATSFVTSAAADNIDAATDEWQGVIAAAKAEGQVVWSTFRDSAVNTRIAAAFTARYGIPVTISIVDTGEFNGRFRAELAAGRQAVDVRSGGSSPRTLPSLPLGTLPMMSEDPSVWILNPFDDIESGHSEAIVYAFETQWFVANNELCPVGDCPESYKELADPAHKGKILLKEPTGTSHGLRVVAAGTEEYGEDWAKGMLQNVAALNDNDSAAFLQIARGEYGIFVHSGVPAELLQLPEPRPFRLIAPTDGQMLSGTGAVLLEGAPHPNAGKLLLNFLLSQEAQQIMADEAGTQIGRTDVTPADPDLVSLPDTVFAEGKEWGGIMSVPYAAGYVKKYQDFSDNVLRGIGLK